MASFFIGGIYDPRVCTVWLAGLRAACPVRPALQTATGIIRPDRRKSFRGEEGFQGEKGDPFPKGAPSPLGGILSYCFSRSSRLSRA